MMLQKLNVGRLILCKPRRFYLIKVPPSRYLSKDRSRLEESLRYLREDEQRRIEEEERRIKLTASSTVAPPVKPSLKDKIVHELKHYYHGFRLLALETRLSAKYAWKLLKGAALSRRERQQLVRTVSDLFRLVPFSIFIIVPFMELLLPIFIKLFPNMLPSTFQESNKEEEKIRKQVKMRVEMAKFLQDTIEELALERKSKKSTSSQALEFAQFMKKVRHEGGYVSNAEILKFSKLFEDELTLDNLNMSQLRSLCRLMSIQSFGSPEILRFQLNMKLRELKADDKQIAAEGGVDALSTLDLQQACRARGMRAVGVSEERLKQQLKQWLELSLNDNIPPSFLLLSRALYLPEDISFTDRLKSLVQNLPDSISEQTKQKLTEIEGGKVDHEARIELLNQIEGAIAKEKQLEEEENKLKEQQKKIDEEKIETKKAETKLLEEDAIKNEATVEQTVETKKKEEPSETKLDPLDLSSIGKAITGDLIHEAKHKLNDLKEKAVEHSELLEKDNLEGDIPDNKVARRLRSKLNNMIEGMDSLLAKLEKEKKSIEEILADPVVPEEVAKKEQKRVKIQDLISKLSSLNESDEHRKERIEQLLKSLDDDKDGFIDGKLVLEVIDILNQYNNVSISASQMAELVGTLRKEGLLASADDKKSK